MDRIYFAFVHGTETSHSVKCVEFFTIWGTISLSVTVVHAVSSLIQSVVKLLIECKLMYLLTAIGLSPGGSSTVHIYTQKYIERYKTNNI